MLLRELKSTDTPAIESIYDLYWTGDFRANLSKRLKGFIENSPDVIAQGFKYFVAEDNGEIVGVAAFRKLPEHMKEYATTNNPVEFYVSAVKYKGKGIGTALRTKRIEEAKALGYTEALFYSGDTHQDSWAFHDNSDFKRVATTTAPNGEVGQIWRMEFK
jgi:L-amino acid N-acyltransferase YncA